MHRTQSGVRVIVALQVCEQRAEIARWGAATGRWSEVIAEVAASMADQMPADLDARAWVAFVDDLAAAFDTRRASGSRLRVVGHGATKVR